MRDERKVKRIIKEAVQPVTSATVREAVRNRPLGKRRSKPRNAKHTKARGRAPVADLEPETRDQVVRIVRGTYDLVETALRNELQRLETDFDDLSDIYPGDVAYLSRLDPKVASAVRAWQGTAAGLIDTPPGLLAIVKAGATATTASAAKRAARVADALLGDEPTEEPLEPDDALTATPLPQNGQD